MPTVLVCGIGSKSKKSIRFEYALGKLCFLDGIKTGKFQLKVLSLMLWVCVCVCVDPKMVEGFFAGNKRWTQICFYYKLYPAIFVPTRHLYVEMIIDACYLVPFHFACSLLFFFGLVNQFVCEHLSVDGGDSDGYLLVPFST